MGAGSTRACALAVPALTAARFRGEGDEAEVADGEGDVRRRRRVGRAAAEAISEEEEVTRSRAALVARETILQ